MKNHAIRFFCAFAAIILSVLSPTTYCRAGIFDNLNKALGSVNAIVKTNPPSQSTQQSSQLPVASSNATTLGESVNNNAGQTQNAPGPSSIKKSPSDLPLILQAIEQCDDTRFTELVNKDMSSINKGVGILQYDSDGNRVDYTPLEYACQYGCTNIISQLLNDYAVNVTPNASKLAAANGRLEAIKMLLKAKAYPMDGVKEAVNNGHVDVLSALIEGGANISKMNSGFGIDLTVPITNGNTEMIKFVLTELATNAPPSGTAF